MRFKLTLEPSGFQRTLPLNYQYELSSWIYKTIHFGNPEFANWLHDHGYMDGYKKFRFFTFSNIITEKYKIKGDRIEILGDCSIYISFYAEEAIEPFILGLFKNQEFRIGDKISRVAFHVGSIEKLLEPEWSETMTFRTQSPIVISIKENENSKTATYLSPGDREFNKGFIHNLYSKIRTISNQQDTYMPVQEYRKPKILLIHDKVRSKLVTIKGGTKDETHVKGYLFDFTITAPVDYIKMGYYAGFGEKNSLGFGSCDVKEI